ncbi:MAG: DmsC/YnfH family molybdoenzyme membrane anchor subunit [Sulfuricurvum sp.]
MNNTPTPLESFISYKADTGMQCGNYSIDVPPLKEGEQYRFHFDATKCVGCRCCEVACNEQNNNPADIKWRRVGEMEGGSFPNTLLLFNSMSCNHCIDPACLIGCPTNSYIKFDNGIVFHDDPSCIGCQYCTWNCPYGVPTYHEERHIVTKCHMCHERLAENQSPACVQACPSGAIEIEAVNIAEWMEKKIDTQGNMPHLADARLTNSTTRFTLPENIPEEMIKADEHHLKPAHGELPLVFMTVLTQMSLGAFGALFIGDILSLFGFFTPNWILAALVMLPAAIGLPLSALHLGRPLKALSAMKNLRTSWLSREAAALGLFTGMMSINVALYYFAIAAPIRLAFELLTMGVGIYGIYAQAMIYRIPARPSWDRISTNQKFFTTAFSGLFLVALALLIIGEVDSLMPLLSSAMIVAVIHGFFTFGAYSELKTSPMPQLEKTLRLYRERFSVIHRIRVATFITGALLLPLLSTLFIVSGLTTASIVTLAIGFVLLVIGELCDRFLFYTTTVPLQMAGGFFVGTQRN